MDITYISKVGDLSSQTMNIISRESKLFQKLRPHHLISCPTLPLSYCLLM